MTIKNEINVVEMIAVSVRPLSLPIYLMLTSNAANGFETLSNILFFALRFHQYFFLNFFFPLHDMC